MKEKQPLLRLEEISYVYPRGGRPALQDITVNIGAGERITVLGGNGAGKSTFFLCCNGVAPPTKGQIYLEGNKIGRSSAELRKLRSSVGLVFQDPDAQMIAATVEEEVAFGPLNLRWALPDVKQATHEALEAMGLKEFCRRAPYELSGGEKKRVSIADILAMKPRVILLDEPTAALDCAHAGLLEETLVKVEEQGLALLISTHDVDFAWRWAQRGLVLCDGKLIADAPIEDIFEDEALLQKAGLGKPMLLETARLVLPKGRMPRTLAELKQRLEEQKK